MIRISARTAAFSSSTVDCTSKLITLQAALHESARWGATSPAIKEVALPQYGFLHRLSPCFAMQNMGSTYGNSTKRHFFQASTFSQARGIQMNVELVRLATSVTRETCLYACRQRSCSLCGTFRDLEQSKAIPIAFLGYSSFPLMLWQGGKRDRQTAGPGEWNRHSGRKAAGNPCCSDDRTAEWAWESACLA